MCGIAGIFGGNPQQDDIQAMVNALKHRGPDATGTAEAPGLRLGHTRLSIVDLSEAGAQPMTTPDGRYILVYNGELYNHADFIPGLQQKGVRFRGHSDTETLLWLLIHHGADILPQLNGIFAFAFYDTQTRDLLLVRDQMGVKPLYYGRGRDGRWLFASEIKALLATGEIQPRLNVADVVELFMFHFIAGTNTSFLDIHELAPGHYMRLTTDNMQIQRYWSLLPDTIADANNPQVIAEQTRTLLERAVDRQLMADVPLGIMLSGGMDSGSVAALAQRELGYQMHGYCFHDPAHGYNEYENARIIADHFQIDLQPVIIDENDIPDLLRRTTWYYDEPIPRPHNLAAYAIAQQARADGLKVLLTGEGGDELFGGYTRYAALHRQMAQTGDTNPLIFANNRAALPRIARLWSQDRFANAYRFWTALETEGFDLVNRQLYVDQQTFLQHFLQRSDRMGMGESIENRVPLLDMELVAFVNQLPGTAKIDANGRTKASLRDATADLIPEAIQHAPKQPFDMPMAESLRTGVMHEFIEEMLLDQPRCGVLFRKDGIRGLVDTMRSGDNHAWKSVWMLLTTEIWLREFKVAI